MNIPCNAPGISGPLDSPEYDGETADELAKQKRDDKGFVQMWAADIPADVYQLLIDGDDLAFCARFRHEMREIAEREATEEHRDNLRAWENNLSAPSNGDVDLEDAA
jgi:hypothetical protein